MGMTDGKSLENGVWVQTHSKLQHESHTFDQRVYDVDILS